MLAVVRNDNLVDLKDDTGSRQLGGRHPLQIMRLGAANGDHGLELWIEGYDGLLRVLE
jgi:hypothetical protein